MLQEDILAISIGVLDYRTGIFMRLNYSYEMSGSPPYTNLFIYVSWSRSSCCCCLLLLLLLNFDVLSLPKRHLKSSTGTLSLAKGCVKLNVDKTIISMQWVVCYYWHTLKTCSESLVRRLLILALSDDRKKCCCCCFPRDLMAKPASLWYVRFPRAFSGLVCA